MKDQSGTSYCIIIIKVLERKKEEREKEKKIKKKRQRKREGREAKRKEERSCMLEVHRNETAGAPKGQT